MDTVALGNKIKQARLELDLTQYEVAEDVITRNMLSQIENGLSIPSLKTLEHLAKKLNKPFSYFLSNEFDEMLTIDKDSKHSFEHSSFLLKNEEYKKCISYIEQVLKELKRKNHNIYYGRLLCILVKCKIEINDYNSINQIINKTIGILQSNKDYYSLASIYFYKSNVLFNNEKFEEAEVYVRKAIEKLSKSYVSDISLETKLFFSLGYILFEQSQFEESVANLNHVLKLSQKHKSFSNYGDAHMLLGILYKKIDDMDKAIDYAKKAVTIFHALDEPNLKAKCDKNLGNYYLIVKNFDNAYRHLNDALVYFNSVKDKEKANTIKSDIQEVLAKRGDYEKAIEYVNEINMDSIKTVDKARIYMNLGNSYTGVKDYVKAKENLNKAKELLKDSNQYDVLTLICDSYSHMYSLIEDYEKAYKYSEKSKEFLKLSLKDNIVGK